MKSRFVAMGDCPAQERSAADRGSHPLTHCSLSLVYCSFNTFVRQHPDLETVMLPIRDGITIIRRRI
jgi:hypothetical protein